MKLNKTIFVALICVITVGVGFYFLTMHSEKIFPSSLVSENDKIPEELIVADLEDSSNSFRNNIPTNVMDENDDEIVQQEIEDSNGPSVNSPNNIVANKIDNRLYSLIDYPLKQSPVYNQLDEEFRTDSYWANAQDTRLVRNDTEVIIPSLIQVISAVQNKEPNGSMVVDIFSIPAVKEHLYLKTRHIFGSDMPYSGIEEIYRLDLLDLSIHELAISDFVRTVDLYRGAAGASYEILANGKNLIKWNMNGVYMINLETDSKNDFFIAPENQWLISSIVFGMGQSAQYDIEVNEDQVVVGIYDKTQTQEGHPINIDQYGNVKIESDTWNREFDTISPKFVDRITISIP